MISTKLSKKKKEEVETRNNAESLIYSSQKTLDELGDKISGEEKAKVETEIENVKKALEGSSSDAIKEATDKLTKVFYELSEKLYKQQGAAGPEVDPDAYTRPDDGEAKEGTVTGEVESNDDDNN